MLGCGGEHVHHCLADLQAEIQFGGRKRFGTVLKMPVRIGPRARFVAHDFCACDSDVAHLIAAHAEDDFTPGRTDSVVEMDDRRARTVEAGKAGADQIGATLREDLDDHIVGNATRLHQPCNEVELGRTGTGKADLDFLNAYLDQQIEETILLMRVHRIDDGLIAVAKVGGKPAGRGGDGARRPLAVGQVDLGEGRVFRAGIAEHGHRITRSVERNAVSETLGRSARLSGTPGHAQGRISRRSSRSEAMEPASRIDARDASPRDRKLLDNCRVSAGIIAFRMQR